MLLNSFKLLPYLLVLGAVWTYWEYVQYIILVILALFLAQITMKIINACKNIYYTFRFRNIDTMDGIRFEHYIGRVLRANGYTGLHFTEKYDDGVDIIACKSGVRWGIQVKRRAGFVGADAVRQVVTGLKVYGCDQAMVITNSHYTSVARRLARYNNCVLIDRVALSRLAG